MIALKKQKKQTNKLGFHCISLNLYRLLNSAWHGVGAPAVGSGMLGGSVTYTEACIFVKEGAHAYFDEESKVPFATRETDWISYENPRSIKAKVRCVIH